MTNARLEKFIIKNYRSIKDLSINFPEKYPFVVCGENNIGKTNILRALNLFFNFNQDDIYYEKEDLPYHIYYGSRGDRKTTLTGVFSIDGIRKKVEIRFVNDATTECKIDGEDAEQEAVLDIIGNIKYYFIESSNINIPEIMSESVEGKILLPLDSRQRKQTKALEKLDEFVKEANKALSPIETEINKYFNEIASSSSVLEGRRIKISFGEYKSLRDALNDIVSITLEDGNENSLETKGSGAQRLVFISLMQYIANSGDRNILWGIDEPEVFLQPKLQKKLNSVFNRISQKSQLIITTHSQHFINTERCENVMLMEAIQTEKTYVRKSGKKFYETDAHEKHFDSDTLKIVAIKNHLGIGDNDGWALMPSNILVEGECDKKYLEMYIEYYKLNAPNIFSADGASKLASKVNYLDIFSKDLPFTPIICCIFDDDDEGIKAFNALHNTYKNITIKRFFISQRSNGQKEKSCPDYEIEDFLPPKLVFDGINGILKDIKYRKISENDFSKREKQAYKKKNILLFMEEIIRSKNSDKDELPLSNPGYKKRLCEKCFSLFQEEPEKYLLSPLNFSFLKKLVNEANEKVES